MDQPGRAGRKECPSASSDLRVQQRGPGGLEAVDLEAAVEDAEEEGVVDDPWWPKSLPSFSSNLSTSSKACQEVKNMQTVERSYSFSILE